MNKHYLKAVNSLYGDSLQIPATIALPNQRSPRTTQQAKPRRNIERGIQTRLVAWALGKGLELLAIGNEGRRTRIGGHIAKQMGLRPGASDLFLAEPVQGCAGYWIELKRPGGKPRENQHEFLAAMRKRGYKAEWFDDWEKARDSILEYLANGRIFTSV